jgi:RimJ/RimL family protein N-acetyltransferase
MRRRDRHGDARLLSFRIAPTTKADCEAFYGREMPHRIKAYTGFIDDEVVCIGGLGFPPDSAPIAFADMKEAARQWPYAVELHRFARRVIKEAQESGVRRIIAKADPSIEAAERWLKRLGFEPLTPDRMYWEWVRSSQS